MCGQDPFGEMFNMPNSPWDGGWSDHVYASLLQSFKTLAPPSSGFCSQWRWQQTEEGEKSLHASSSHKLMN